MLSSTASHNRTVPLMRSEHLMLRSGYTASSRLSNQPRQKQDGPAVFLARRVRGG